MVDYKGMGLKKVDGSSGPTPKPIAIKNTVRHLAGQTLSSMQQQGAERAGGMNARFCVDQVRNLLAYDLVDTGNTKLVDDLRLLHADLDRWLSLRTV